MNLIYTLNSAYCESIVIFFNVFKTRRRHVATLSHAAHLKSIDHKLKINKSKNSEFQADNIISLFESLFFCLLPPGFRLGHRSRDSSGIPDLIGGRTLIGQFAPVQNDIFNQQHHEAWLHCQSEKTKIRRLTEDKGRKF